MRRWIASLLQKVRRTHKVCSKSLLTQGNLIVCLSCNSPVGQHVRFMNMEFSPTHLSCIWGVTNRNTMIVNALTMESHIRLTRNKFGLGCMDSGCQATWIFRVKTLVQAMGASTESDFRGYHEGNEEEKMKVKFLVLLPGKRGQEWTAWRAFANSNELQNSQ